MNEAKSYETKDIPYNDSLFVNLLYNSLFGRVLLKLLIKPTVSKLAGLIMDSSASRFFIRSFIKRNNIKIEEYKNIKYKSFNDFFIRQIEKGLRLFSVNEYDVASPCDGKLTAYTITEESVFYIKNSVYSVDMLLQDKKIADEFMNGICLIFRLTPDDYHRYCYIDSGKIVYYKRIKGVLHTVRPIALQRYNIYTQNSREYALLKTKNFGKAIQMEVGALFVGRIVNHRTKGSFKRGEEKGMFQFGGSTIVMLFQKGAIKLNHIIFENTQQNKETVVRMGDKIGEKNMCGEEKTQ